MIKHQYDIDIDIDRNLKILCASENPYEFDLSNFIDKNGRQIHLKKRHEEFASLMEEKGLIRVNGFKCAVKKFGLEVFKYGGWLKYISDQEKQENELELKQRENENLDSEIKLLQKDKLLYEQKIRAQNDRIRNLEEQIKFVNLLKQYWWFIGVCITIGIFLVKVWDIVKPE